jgi:hypothetical protein
LAAEPTPVAAVIVVPGGDQTAAAVASAVAAALEAGLAPVVVVGPASLPLPAGVVAVRQPPPRLGRDDPTASALRHGLARLANTPATGALLATATSDLAAPAERLRALLAAARASGATLAVPLHAGVRVGPVYAARDAWREILTHPAGLPGVLAAHEGAVLEVDVSV